MGAWYDIGPNGEFKDREMTEKEIENGILAYLNLLPGCFAWKCQTVGMWDKDKQIYRKSKNKYHIKGVSDILGIYKGRMLAIEVKRPRNKPTEDQQKFLERVGRLGGIAVVAYSVDDVIKSIANAAGI